VDDDGDGREERGERGERWAGEGKGRKRDGLGTTLRAYLPGQLKEQGRACEFKVTSETLEVSIACKAWEL